MIPQEEIESLSEFSNSNPASKSKIAPRAEQKKTITRVNQTLSTSGHKRQHQLKHTTNSNKKVTPGRHTNSRSFGGDSRLDSRHSSGGDSRLGSRSFASSSHRRNSPPMKSVDNADAAASDDQLVGIDVRFNFQPVENESYLAMPGTDWIYHPKERKYQNKVTYQFSDKAPAGEDLFKHQLGLGHRGGANNSAVSFGGDTRRKSRYQGGGGGGYTNMGMLNGQMGGQNVQMGGQMGGQAMMNNNMMGGNMGMNNMMIGGNNMMGGGHQMMQGNNMNMMGGQMGNQMMMGGGNMGMNNMNMIGGQQQQMMQGNNMMGGSQQMMQGNNMNMNMMGGQF